MRLEKLCTVFTDGDWIESKDQSISGIRLIQTGNIGDGIYLEKEERAKYISEDTFERLKCTEVFSGDVLVSRLPEPVGRACIIPEKNERMITAVDCSICRPNEDIISKEYLCYFMRSRAYFTKLLGNVTGTTRKRISRKNLGNIELDVHSKEEQNEVVKRLNCLVKVINLRNKEIQLLDQFIRARFVELFGDPVTNPKNLPVVILRELSRLITKGASPSWQGFSYTEDSSQTLFITSENVREGYIDLSSPKYVEDGFNEKQNRSMIHKGDFLINIVGASIGRAAQFELDCKANMNQAAALVRMDDNRIRDKYLLVYLNSERAQQMYNSMKSDTGRANLSLQDIADLSILLPEVNEQIEFETFVRQVDKSKLSPKQSTTLHYKSIFTQIQTLQITNIFYLETESEAFHQNDKRRIISMGKTRIWHGSGISVEGFERSAASGG
ncbi:restriction endonuclease subunit S [Clostridium sp. OM05-5BH]|uniref:restriction endonuclease subunit S n=1 Tax=Clostridium sp. OM05-5BH TaxID=2293043 RepID=UPI0015FCEFCC|nr:restriction endonuclease subunit S [Clostridium sp. OM05-5BH]